ncbi:hypothetical protein HK098_006656 [Nowakowskiella sp. JEL0407]|nr:hypothetical protein HK098_006656 [Nowakowskiella sp. JEL0407]
MTDLTPARKRNIIVLGAGVQGLAVACLLKSGGHNVSISSKSSPTSPETDPYYTSPKAGANWQSYATSNDLRLQSFDEITFRAMWRLCDTDDGASKAAGIIKTNGIQYFTKKPKNFKFPWYCESGLTPNFRELEHDELLDGIEFGFQFDTLLINAPKFLTWLLNKYEALGGSIVLEETTRLSDLYNRNPDVDIVINCSGIGARTLGDVEDQTVKPGRGQIIIVDAPQVKPTISFDIGDVFGNKEEVTYVIPRDDGTVILGGTYQIGNSDLNPDPEIAKGIMDRCIKICPELLSPNGDKPKILKHVVGLRPSRDDGIRLDSEVKISSTGKAVLVIHNYGHGGYGFQSSFGCGQSVLGIVNQYCGTIEPTLNSFTSAMIEHPPHKYMQYTHLHQEKVLNVV